MTRHIDNIAQDAANAVSTRTNQVRRDRDIKGGKMAVTFNLPIGQVEWIRGEAIRCGLSYSEFMSRVVMAVMGDDDNGGTNDD